MSTSSGSAMSRPDIESILAPDGSYFLNIKEHADDGERNLYVMDLVIAHRRQWGWRFVDEFCWRKTDNGVPGGWGNRFKNAWEPVFHFCRQQRDQVSAAGGEPRVGGLLRLLARTTRNQTPGAGSWAPARGARPRTAGRTRVRGSAAGTVCPTIRMAGTPDWRARAT